MKAILSAITLSMVFTSTAFAQCYGDAAQAFGCGVSSPSQSTLESFGDSRNDVVPNYYDDARPVRAGDLFSPQETLGFYRRLYQNGNGSNFSESAFRNSVNSQARPLRAFRRFPSAPIRY